MTGEVTLYSDGGCVNNPGQGGYGIILEQKTENQTTSEEILQGYRHTTNNRMEMMGVIIGLKKLKGEKRKVNVYTDSRYVVDAFEKKWVFQWEKKDFQNRINADLWRQLLKVYRKHQVIFHWVKGHDADPRNERCDQLVALAIRRRGWFTDRGYTHNDG